MSDVLFIILIVLLAALAFITIPPLLIRRAISSVIQIFRQHSATDVKSARTIDELGLGPRPMAKRIFRRRDYKPQALQILMRAEVVQMTEDDKLYLSEEKLASSGLHKR